MGRPAKQKLRTHMPPGPSGRVMLLGTARRPREGACHDGSRSPARAAAREAARRGAVVTGVDPAPLMLALGRRLSRGRTRRHIAFVEGTAEALPVADRSVTVVWAISSAHHWADTGAGLRELHRVLEPGGRLIIAERLARPGARGHAAHGFTTAQAAQTAAAARAAGFAGAEHETHRAGRRMLAVVRAHCAAAEPR